MNIVQVIANIINDEEKEFEGSLDGFSYRISCINGELETMVINENIGEGVKKIILGLPYTRILKKVDWELVQKPVTFMEVGKSKNIRIEHDLLLDCDKLTFRDTREMLSYLVKTFINSGVVEILTEGKFYIKEDN